MMAGCWGSSAHGPSLKSNITEVINLSMSLFYFIKGGFF